MLGDIAVASGDYLSVDAVVVLKGITNFFRELLSSIHDNLCWPWVASEPGELKLIDNFVGLFLVYFIDLEPSGCRINHSKAV